MAGSLNPAGCGLGLRRQFLQELLEQPPQTVDFFEVAPENWMKIGGQLGKQFRKLTEQAKFVCHGLSLSIGSCDPLDVDFVTGVKRFMQQHGIELYSEHLSYCSHQGHLYDLMPMPFTSDAVSHTAARIRQVQDILERKIAMENISYYAVAAAELSESEFFNAVVAEADCLILVDINNIYVNSVNHGYDAIDFLNALPAERIVYAHMAGHYRQSDNLLIDTHGAPVIDPVWRLLASAYQRYGAVPTLLERDFNLPPLTELLREVGAIAALQQAASVKQVA